MDIERDMRGTRTQRKDHLRTHKEGGHLQAKERDASGEIIKSANIWILDFQPQNYEKINFCCLSPSL